MSEAEQLKAEGNALFVKNDFSAAYKKYSQALGHDDKSAIIYCNRAACSLGLNRFLDASTDAAKATELDPTYAKAWGRLAAAYSGLNRSDKAVDAWKKAVAALPSDNLTPAQQKQKTQYQESLAAATAQLEREKQRARQPTGVAISNTNQMPWIRASSKIPDLAARNDPDSSAWVITYAHTQWQQAIDWMNMGKFIRAPGSSQQGYYGRLGVIEGLTNALISDRRIFHIADKDFLEKYNRQMIFEATRTKAWVDIGAKQVMVELPKRLRAEGWDSVRPALSLTVRGWIMRAFFEDSLRNKPETTVEFYTSALEVLKWGNETYRSVSNEDKGAIFEPTFSRGIKCLRIDTMMKLCAINSGNAKKLLLKDLLAGAEELLEEMSNLPVDPPYGNAGPGFYNAFFRYPIGLAHAMRAFYYLESGKAIRNENGQMTQEAMGLYSKSAVEYLAASQNYPLDDERHVWFVHCAMHSFHEVGMPLRLFLQELDHIHSLIPIMKQIWEFTAEAQQRDAALQADMELRDNMQYARESGQFAGQDMDTAIVTPPNSI